MKLLYICLLSIAVGLVTQKPIIISGKPFGTSLEKNINTGKCDQLSPIRNVQHHRELSNERPVITSKRESGTENKHHQKLYLEIVGIDQDHVLTEMLRQCPEIKWYDGNFLNNDIPEYEVIPIISSGDPDNRIDVVFMGDGYTMNERELFIDDINRLVSDMWNGITFSSQLPLFNIWAVFAPSNESGIGTNSTPKDTTFGLYRDGTELRGIYTSKPNVARQICEDIKHCDYPSIIGNDDFYGGLGGEFVIATRSETSGSVVLRHEMGHNFVNVGEEYDGGQVYDGVNSARSLQTIGWTEWLSDPKNLREEASSLLVQNYAWYDMANGDFIIKFSATGNGTSWLLRLSVSGYKGNNTLQVYLDSKLLPQKSIESMDRTFVEWEETQALSRGLHELRIAQLPNEIQQIRQLCSLDFHEFNDALFNKEYNFIGAFPVINWKGKKSYRPTNDQCLMRNMASHKFCPVCQEGLWLNLLKRISFIDKVEQICSDKKATISLQLLPLGRLRARPREKEDFQIKWLHHGLELPNSANQTKINISSMEGEIIEVVVEFRTPEIRKADPLLISREVLTVCS